MARRGEAIHKRGPSWFLDCEINGVHYHKKLDKGISRSVALELAQVERAAILKGKLELARNRRTSALTTLERRSEPGRKPIRSVGPRVPMRNVCAGWRSPSAASVSASYLHSPSRSTSNSAFRLEPAYGRTASWPSSRTCSIAAESGSCSRARIRSPA